ncbi:hypothetical protein [Bacillus sp. 196mf]|uniref:hypothetical protein n=1 Tax=Bacillus sp. 196mf TaxID=1761754 RepID=UPI000D7C1DF7|nr:hypothetical protein [Bacillus sp. 196mf]PYE88348.1 hypothetical protein ATL10_10466 [Bacillus sp. 196mf]
MKQDEKGYAQISNESCSSKYAYGTNYGVSVNSVDGEVAQGKGKITKKQEEKNKQKEKDNKKDKP